MLRWLSAIPWIVSMLLVRAAVDRLGDNFCIGDRRRIERGSPPSHIERQTRKIDNATVPAITAQVVSCTHEDAVDGARLDTQCTKHALRVVDRVASDFKTLAVLNAFLADVNAVDRAGLRTLIARDAGREIESVKAAITRGNWNREFRVLEMFSKGFTL